MAALEDDADDGICRELEARYGDLKTGDVVRYPCSYYGIEVLGLVIGKESIVSHPGGHYLLWLYIFNDSTRGQRVGFKVSTVWPRVELIFRPVLDVDAQSCT